MSLRVLARIQGAPGAVAAMYAYFNDTQETDVELRTSDPASVVWGNNQPTWDGDGNAVAGSTLNMSIASAVSEPGKAAAEGGAAYGVGHYYDGRRKRRWRRESDGGGDDDEQEREGQGLQEEDKEAEKGWATWHIYRLDWSLGSSPSSAWYVDRILLGQSHVNVPVVPSLLKLAMFSNGGTWSGTMAAGNEATFQVGWIQMFFNVSRPGAAGETVMDGTGEEKGRQRECFVDEEEFDETLSQVESGSRKTKNEESSTVKLQAALRLGTRATLTAFEVALAAILM